LPETVPAEVFRKRGATSVIYCERTKREPFVIRVWFGPPEELRAGRIRRGNPDCCLKYARNLDATSGKPIWTEDGLLELRSPPTLKTHLWRADAEPRGEPQPAAE
jgi:hypothetical protein